MPRQLRLVSDASDARLDWEAEFERFWWPWRGWQKREKEAAKNLFKALVTTGRDLKIEGETNFYHPTCRELQTASIAFIAAERAKPDADPQMTPRARKWLRNAMWRDWLDGEPPAAARPSNRRAVDDELDAIDKMALDLWGDDG